MAYDDVTSSDAVVKAMQECDRLGRMKFLRKYGFGKAGEFFVEHDGRLYDSKAILGVAHGYQFPEEGPLTSGDFWGGKTTVKPTLEKLGFTVHSIPGGIRNDEDMVTRHQQ